MCVDLLVRDTTSGNKGPKYKKNFCEIEILLKVGTDSKDDHSEWKSVSGIFQQIMDIVLNDLDFVIANLEDTLIENESLEQHSLYVKYFQRIKKIWLENALDKCESSKI